MTEAQKKRIEEDVKNEKESALANGYKYTYCGICGKKLNIKKAYGATTRSNEYEDNVFCWTQFICKKCFKEIATTAKGIKDEVMKRGS